VLDWTLEPPAMPSPEEPTSSALPIVRGLIDGTLWDGMEMQPIPGRRYGEVAQEAGEGAR
jgi:hypothetical protein